MLLEIIFFDVFTVLYPTFQNTQSLNQ